jgi:hypothetical protein
MHEAAFQAKPAPVAGFAAFTRAWRERDWKTSSAGSGTRSRDRLRGFARLESRPEVLPWRVTKVVVYFV